MSAIKKKIIQHRYPHREKLSTANITWQGNSLISADYNDVYFSRDDAIAESEYVFLQQNQLPQRWQGKPGFTIIETGFGSGLNFYISVDAWLQSTANDSVLTYISVEKHPFTTEHLHQLKTVWPQYSGTIDELLTSYPRNTSGFNTLSLFNGRVRLMLLFGDALAMLSQLHAKADAWYLDGFAPSTNTAMWQNSLFHQVARLTKVGGSFSTFTAAGDVRRGLLDAGFEVNKIKGFGQKRHMLSGVLNQESLIENAKPWFKPQAIVNKPETAIIIGAGIAGCSTAAAFARKGIKVTLLEKAGSIATGASGNHSGVVMPRLDKSASFENDFYWQAFDASLQYFNQMADDIFQQCGVLHLIEKNQFQACAEQCSDDIEVLSVEEIKQRFDLNVQKPGLWVQQAGVVRPALFCQQLLDAFEKEITLKTGQTVTSMTKINDGWQVKTESAVFAADVIVFANGESVTQFAGMEQIPVAPVSGQVSYFSPSRVNIKSRYVISDNGYLVPEVNGLITLGATFHRNNSETGITEEDHQKNIEMINTMLPGCLDNDVSACSGKKSVRAVTPDRLPVVGAVPDFSFYNEHYCDLCRGYRADSYDSAQYLEGLYLNSGHGSRGLTSALLCAEYLASLVTDSASPLPVEFSERLHPARFTIRKLLKQPAPV